MHVSPNKYQSTTTPTLREAFKPWLLSLILHQATAPHAGIKSYKLTQ